MPQITDKEYEQFKVLRKIFLHSNPDKFEGVYFICGETGGKDELGLPEYITVCPAYGVDANLTKRYKSIERLEAEVDFGIVDEEQVEFWQKKLNERFGIGSGKLMPLEEPEDYN